jgi:taurine dioxygenase
MTVQIVPMAPFGAQVGNIDLSAPIGAADFRVLLDALYRHSVLLFRGQTLTKAQLVRFSGLFGTLQRHVLSQWLDEDVPEVLLVANKAAVGPGRPVYSELGSRFWHSDMSINKPSGFATILYGVEVPSSGGTTEVADMYAAYESLPAAMKERIADLWAVHDLKYNFEHIGKHLTDEQRQGRQLSEEQKRNTPAVEYPVVRVHPVTGRRALYVGLAHTSHIVGMPVEEGRRLVHELVELATQPQFVYSHAWRPGDVLCWDNRCTLHRGTPYPEGERRMLWRTTSIEAAA